MSLLIPKYSFKQYDACAKILEKIIMILLLLVVINEVLYSTNIFVCEYIEPVIYSLLVPQALVYQMIATRASRCNYDEFKPKKKKIRGNDDAKNQKSEELLYEINQRSCSLFMDILVPFILLGSNTMNKFEPFVLLFMLLIVTVYKVFDLKAKWQSSICMGLLLICTLIFNSIQISTIDLLFKVFIVVSYIIASVICSITLKKSR